VIALPRKAGRAIDGESGAVGGLHLEGRLIKGESGAVGGLHLEDRLIKNIPIVQNKIKLFGAAAED
jgi:hypothetical protein